MRTVAFLDYNSMFKTNSTSEVVMTLDKKTIMTISFATLFTLSMVFAPSLQMASAGFDPCMSPTVYQLDGATWMQEDKEVTFATHGDGYIIKGTGTPNNQVANVIQGSDGDDIINGGWGDDIICGGDGNDTLKGGWGNDRLYGDEGDDLLKGGHGNDTLVGGNDTDEAQGGRGNDSCSAEVESSC